MWLLDVNILLYAFRADVPEHAATNAWLEAMLASGTEFHLPELVQVGFVRVATHSIILPQMARPTETWDFLQVLSAQAGYRESPSTPAIRARWRQLCEQGNLRNNQVVDAYLAALVLTHGLTLVTHDTDFRRFRGLKVFDPLAKGKI